MASLSPWQPVLGSADHCCYGNEDWFGTRGQWRWCLFYRLMRVCKIYCLCVIVYMCVFVSGSAGMCAFVHNSLPQLHRLNTHHTPDIHLGVAQGTLPSLT